MGDRKGLIFDLSATANLTSGEEGFVFHSQERKVGESGLRFFDAHSDIKGGRRWWETKPSTYIH